MVKPNYGCPVKSTTRIMAGKWKVAILWHLSFGTKRFAELRDLLPGVSEKVLTAQLRQLENDGVIERQVKSSNPPQVTYRLSQAGADLIPMMTELCHWGTRYLGIPPNLPMIRKAGQRKAAASRSRSRRRKKIAA